MQHCQYRTGSKRCPYEADLVCHIGSCAPGTWYCAYHYGQVHLPENERDTYDMALRKGGKRVMNSLALDIWGGCYALVLLIIAHPWFDLLVALVFIVWKLRKKG